MSEQLHITRRSVLRGAAAAAATVSIVPSHVFGAKGSPSANEKLNLGCIGVGGWMGRIDLQNMSSENIYALCDVDQKYLGHAAKSHPSAKTYDDYRRMLDAEYKSLDAVTITVPDHMHASIAYAAMERGLHVFCQKPLTQTVWEARLLTTAAKKFGVSTQMGNQGYATEANRVAAEMIWDGAIGEVTEVHAMRNEKAWGNKGKWLPAKRTPKSLDWDLWLGRAQDRPYAQGVHPKGWRGYLDFGTNQIGDWAIHMLGPANMALALGPPTSVECIYVEKVNPVTWPYYAVRFEFPERPCKHVPSGKMPPLTVTWYENCKQLFKPPAGWGRGRNTLYVGTKGNMATSDKGESPRLIPESAMAGFKKPPRVLERVTGGIYVDWIRSCKEGGKPACSNFSVAGPYTEWLLLGSIAWRFPKQKLLWDGENLRFTNNEKANEFVKPTFRKGWELPELASL